MSDTLTDHLEAALDAAEDDDVRYHLREALQLRLCESEDERDRLSA